MEYGTSFFFLILNGAILPFGSLFGIFVMFEKFGHIKGWTYYEVLFTLSVINIGHAAGETVFRGFDLFSRQIRNATFDRILLRPRSTVVQVLGAEFEFSRLGRLGINVFFLCLAISHLPVTWDAMKCFTLALMLVGVSCIYFGIMMIRAALCFWTVEGLEITNILIDGGREALQYPISIYNKGFRFVFTYIIPFAVANYYPTLYLLGKENGNSLLYALSPMLGISFIIPCYLIWRMGIRHYSGTGS